ncbi:MAG: YbhB/YbcL family Raf kinase inhibitor-like protein [Christensenellaceae bacterium]|jgi:Raf kinase inhibitor-like YbhB/YbcL family protein
MERNLTVTSPAFENDGAIPIKYTGRGEDLSPELRLSEIDPGAKSIAIIMDDVDHPLPYYNHWVIWNIPVMPVIPEAIPRGAQVATLNGAVQGRGYGKHRYRGPKPPFNWSHRYQFNVYVLDTLLDLPAKTKKNALLDAMEGHILQQGFLTGKFSSR